MYTNVDVFWSQAKSYFDAGRAIASARRWVVIIGGLTIMAVVARVPSANVMIVGVALFYSHGTSH